MNDNQAAKFDRAATRAIEMLRGAKSLNDIAQDLIEVLAVETRSDRGVYWTVDEELQCLRVVAARNDLGCMPATRERATYNRMLSLSERNARQVWRNKKPMWATQLALEMCLPRSLMAAAPGLQGGVCFAVKSDTAVYGMIELRRPGLAPKTPDGLISAERLGYRLGYAIEEMRHGKARLPPLRAALGVVDLEALTSSLQTARAFLANLAISGLAAPRVNGLSPLVLFVSRANPAASIMAQAILRHLAHGRVRAASAADFPESPMNPYALECLHGHGIESNELRVKRLGEFFGCSRPPVRFLIALGDIDLAPTKDQQERQHSIVARWTMPGPADISGEADIRIELSRTFRTLHVRIEKFLALPFGRLSDRELAEELLRIGEGP